MNDFSEKRDFPRMALDSLLDYLPAGESDLRQGRLRNLSARGVLFLTAEELQPDQQLKIMVTPVNTITPPMSAQARVLRCDEVAPEDGDERSWLVACALDRID